MFACLLSCLFLFVYQDACLYLFLLVLALVCLPACVCVCLRPCFFVCLCVCMLSSFLSCFRLCMSCMFFFSLTCLFTLLPASVFAFMSALCLVSVCFTLLVYSGRLINCFPIFLLSLQCFIYLSVYQHKLECDSCVNICHVQVLICSFTCLFAWLPTASIFFFTNRIRLPFVC